MLETQLLCRLKARVNKNKVLVAVCLAGIVLQLSFTLAPGVVDFVVLRMLQTGVVASISPSIFSSFSADLDANVIGFPRSGLPVTPWGRSSRRPSLPLPIWTWMYLRAFLETPFAVAEGFQTGSECRRDRTRRPGGVRASVCRRPGGVGRGSGPRGGRGMTAGCGRAQLQEAVRHPRPRGQPALLRRRAGEVDGYLRREPVRLSDRRQSPDPRGVRRVHARAGAHQPSGWAWRSFPPQRPGGTDPLSALDRGDLIRRP